MPSAVDEKPTKRSSSMRNLFEPGPFSLRLALTHLTHIFMLVVNILVLITGAMKWEQRVNIDPARIGSVQSTANAVFQAFFTAVLALMFWLSQTIAISRTIQETRSLLAIHFTVEAWNSFSTIILSIQRLFSINGSHATRQIMVLIAIFLYFAFGSALQITSSGVLGIEVYTVLISAPTTSGLNSIGDYIGFDDAINESPEPLTSNQSTIAFGRWLWQASRLSMFSAGANNTFRPGIEGRILHDTISPAYSGYELAIVNATGMNVRCYQPTDATVTAFLLPFNTTDFDKAVYPDGSGYINGTNLDHLVSLWLNVSMPVPPYWNSSVPGLTFTQKWAENPFRPDTLPYYGHTLPTRIFMQPWVFRTDPDVFYGHHQVAMVLASAPNALVRGTNGAGRILNVTADLTLTNSFCSNCTAAGTCNTNSSVAWGCTPGPLSGALQVIGCSFSTNQAYVNITNSGLLANNTENWNSTSRLPRPWSDFGWETQCPVEMDRQFLTIFSPSAERDLPDQTQVPFYERDLSPSERLLSRVFNANANSGPPSNISIEAFEDAMEHYAASYFWSFGRSCDDVNDTLPLTPSYTSDGCRYFRELNAFQRDGRNVTALTRVVKAKLRIVTWRAVASVACSFVLCILAIVLLGVPPLRSPPLYMSRAIPTENSASSELTPLSTATHMARVSRGTIVSHRDPRQAIQRSGIIDMIELMQHSSLPESIGEVTRGTSRENADRYRSMSGVHVRYVLDDEFGTAKLDEATNL